MKSGIRLRLEIAYILSRTLASWAENFGSEFPISHSKNNAISYIFRAVIRKNK